MADYLGVVFGLVFLEPGKLLFFTVDFLSSSSIFNWD